jgi:quercetin dioxygenase-like cupin family protein
MAIYAARIACVTVLALFMVSAFAQGSALEPARLVSEELRWAAVPTGAQRAILAGDEKKAGMYAYRAKFPANFRNQPHFHPDDRIATVISGTLYVGFGEQFDESKLKALPAGSIWTEPAKQPHFVWAKDGEVVIQIIGNGPSGVTVIQAKP